MDTMEQGCSLYRTVKARFILSGTTLGKWCRENGVTFAWAYQCLTGRRTGPAANAMIAKVIAALE